MSGSALVAVSSLASAVKQAAGDVGMTAESALTSAVRQAAGEVEVTVRSALASAARQTAGGVDVALVEAESTVGKQPRQRQCSQAVAVALELKCCSTTLPLRLKRSEA